MDQFDRTHPNDEEMFREQKEIVEPKQNFYFTFGSRDQIYQGGYIKIIARDLREAQDKFIVRYGVKAFQMPNVLNYAFDYKEDEFLEGYEQVMDTPAFPCHEVIE